MPSKNKGKNKEKQNSPPTRPRHRKAADKLMMRFYEPLVLQHVLGPTRGDRIQCEPLDSLDESELDNGNLRRSFLNQLAYICDFKTGGATVTAIALEQRPTGVVFWVVANENVKEKVVKALGEILKDLAGLDGGTTRERAATVEERTFRQAAELGMPRLKSYRKLMQGPLEECLKILNREPENEQDKGELTISLHRYLEKNNLLLPEMIAWLSSFKNHEEDMLQLCRFAYDARAKPYMKKLNKRSRKGSTLTVKSNETMFLELRHYIGRLGSHVRAARILVTAAMAFPTFFDDFEIEYLPSSKPAELPPPTDEKTTLDGVIVRMLKNQEELLFYQDALKTMDTKFGIYKRLKNEYENPTFLPRVHAELILLEHSYKRGYDFVDNDKYIGCSKPACYCCYHYISAHPGGFARPASHNKTYLAWRPPDIVDDTDESEVKRHKDIINKMVEHIRRDVLEQIERQSGRRRTHPDSTTGITPTLDFSHQASRVSFTLPFNLHEAALSSGAYSIKSSANSRGIVTASLLRMANIM